MKTKPDGYHELTEGEKFAMCVAAGVPIEIISEKDGSFRMVTRESCGVVETFPGEFMVATKSQ